MAEALAQMMSLNPTAAEDSSQPEYNPGDDRPLAEIGPTVVQAIMACKIEAEDARMDRDAKTAKNREAYFGKQDWSHKQKGQSKEFLNKTEQAVDRIAAFIKRGLVSFGDWFAAETTPNPLNPSPLSDEQIRALLLHWLGPSSEDAHSLNFPTVLEDGTKVGLLGGNIILKVGGYACPTRKMVTERVTQFIDSPMGPIPQITENLATVDATHWKLKIDLIAPEDYFPDPSGRGLYEIHRVIRDLYQVIDDSQGEYPIYDPEVVELLRQGYKDPEQEKIWLEWTNQNPTTEPGFRKLVEILEFWGTLLDNDGNVVARNVVAAVANRKYLIRPPEPNPFWHQESPFVVSPLVRVPFSVHHKALFDAAVKLNFALNELFNLIVDGGLASVWGIKQLRTDLLDDESQISDGISQGDTLKVKQETPAGVKVLETVTTGETPRDALAVFGIVESAFRDASLVNEVAMGEIPNEDVKATAIVEAQQNSAVAFESMIFDLENNLIRPVLRKGWLTALQNFDSWDADDVVALIGPVAAVTLSRMSPAQRFVTLAKGAKFQVRGLSALVARARDFQKLMAVMQAINANSVLLQSFFRRYNPDKVLAQLLKLLNINPQPLELSPEEQMQTMQRLQELAMFQQITTGTGSNRGAGGGAGPSAQATGEASLPAEINQASNPMTGLVG